MKSRSGRISGLHGLYANESQRATGCCGGGSVRTSTAMAFFVAAAGCHGLAPGRVDAWCNIRASTQPFIVGGKEGLVV